MHTVHYPMIDLIRVNQMLKYMQVTYNISEEELNPTYPEYIKGISVILTSVTQITPAWILIQFYCIILIPTAWTDLCPSINIPLNYNRYMISLKSQVQTQTPMTNSQDSKCLFPRGFIVYKNYLVSNETFFKSKFNFG